MIGDGLIVLEAVLREHVFPEPDCPMTAVDAPCADALRLLSEIGRVRIIRDERGIVVAEWAQLPAAMEGKP